MDFKLNVVDDTKQGEWLNQAMSLRYKSKVKGKQWLEDQGTNARLGAEASTCVNSEELINP